MFDIKEISPIPARFHNIDIPVYPLEVQLEDITFWKENYRTILAFDLLKDKLRKPLKDLSLEEIVDFLAKRIKLRPLANSIERNKVRVPLIILEDGTLLDGNRRYFACHYLRLRSERKGNPRPPALNFIPVWIIKKKDYDDTKREKILAEANFVDDCKAPWTLDVKAQVIDEYFKHCVDKLRMPPERAYEEILEVYTVERDEAEAYIETMNLVKEFMASASSEEKLTYREIVQDKFVYFWEFRNKALKKRELYHDEEIPKLEKLFFHMMVNNRFKNMKQIEPMIRAVKDNYLWEILNSSSGAKIDQVYALYKEEAAIKSAEDKVRNFLRWLSAKADPKNFTNATFSLLQKMIEVCQKIVNVQKR